MRRHLRTSLHALPIVLIAMLTEIATGRRGIGRHMDRQPSHRRGKLKAQS